MLLKIKFYGEVQGVCFRATARNEARELEIKCEAVNCPDGTVELSVEGPKEKLNALIERLKARFAVSKVEIKESQV